MDWFRLYDEIMDDPKLVLLTDAKCWGYVRLLCVANRQPVRGTLPSVKHIAAHLRMKPGAVESLLKELIECGLVDEDPSTKALAIHGWEKRQRQSDDAAGRMSRIRSERKFGTCSEHVRPKPEPHACASETETDTETNQLSPLPPRGGGRDRPDLDQPEKPNAVASTPEQTAEVVELSTAVFAPLGADTWVSRCQGYCALWPADWVKALVPLVAEKLRNDPFTGDAYGRKTLQAWTRQGGPPADLLLAGRDAPLGPPPPPRQRPRTEYQKQIARFSGAFSEVERAIAEEEALKNGYHP